MRNRHHARPVILRLPDDAGAPGWTISERSWASDSAALKAWNRSTGSRYTGEPGGWIWHASADGTATGRRPLCQGWQALAARVGVALVLDNTAGPRTRTRYRYATRTPR